MRAFGTIVAAKPYVALFWRTFAVFEWVIFLMFSFLRSEKMRPYMRPPVLGAAFGFLLVMGSIMVSAHGFLAFFSLEGLLIVGGGVIAVAFMSYDVEVVRKALKAIADMLKEPVVEPKNLNRDVKNIVSWARLLHEKNLRALESGVDKSAIEDPFVKYGLNMVASEYAPDDIRAMMETAADASMEREMETVDVLEAMTSHGPAFGMVGTLVGMVTMLSRLNTDNIADIGSSLSVAFLATLYGVLSARMLYMPASVRVKQDVDTQRFRHQLIIEGMVMLAARKQPMFIQDRLNSFLHVETYNYDDIFARRASAVRLKAVSA